tara:strand:+ start:2612 stop:3727 length:1116 start_codon:yes stop_codon:yes gene_type:complete
MKTQIQTQEHSRIAGRNIKPFVMAKDSVDQVGSLSKLGVCIDSANLSLMASATGMDADLQGGVLQGGASVPVQFLQNWLPGFVEVVTAARKIDILVGISTVGNWSDEEIVQGILELTGSATEYGDHTNIPLSSYQVSYERRTVVRFEEGLIVGMLEEARGAAANINTANNKRQSAARALEIIRNRIGFYGYNDGANRTYGLLNDPALLPYNTVPVGVGGNTEWSTKTFLEIQKDVKAGLSALRTQSGDTIDPSSTPITLALAMSARDFMSTTSDQGVSVQKWLTENYPSVRVESAPEFDDANGGENVGYMYADVVDDGSDDDNRTFVQVVPAKFKTLGVEKNAKSYTEDFTNATAGIMTKRPYAVYRMTGI